MKFLRFINLRTGLAYAALLGVLFLNSGAGCGGKKDDPQPDNFQTLVGRWQAQSAFYKITKQDGSTLQTGADFTKNGTVIVWEFFSDGRLVATQEKDAFQEAQRREVHWELTVSQLDGKDINDGKLKIIGDEERKLAELIGQSGDLTYEIGTSSASANNPALMNLTVDVTKTGPYKKNVLVYTYKKL